MKKNTITVCFKAMHLVLKKKKEKKKVIINLEGTE